MSDVQRIEVDVFVTEHRLDAYDVTRMGRPPEYVGGSTHVGGIIVGGELHGELVERKADPPPLPALGSVHRWTVTVERSQRESLRVYA